MDYFGKMGFQNPELSNPADYFMSIMSIESIQKRDVDPYDTAAVVSSVIEVQDKYNARIKQFDKSYQDSELKNDLNEQYPGIKEITNSDLSSRVQVSWLY